MKILLKIIKGFYHQYLARPLYQIIRPLQSFFKFKERTFFDKFKIKTKDGVEFWLYNNAFSLETRLFWNGFDECDWEKKSREIWRELSINSKVVLDIGSNTGIYSVLAKAYNPNSEVHAFEPQPNIFNILEKNNIINGYDIYCHQIALSSYIGISPFYNSGINTFEASNTTHGSLNKEWRSSDQYSINVKVNRLDEFLKIRNIQKVDLVKIDVETLEFEVLQGYGDLLFIHRPIILVEIQNVDIGKNISNLFIEKEYKFYWIDEKVGLVNVDELGTLTIQSSLNYLLVPC